MEQFRDRDENAMRTTPTQNGFEGNTRNKVSTNPFPGLYTGSPLHGSGSISQETVETLRVDKQHLYAEKLHFMNMCDAKDKQISELKKAIHDLDYTRSRYQAKYEYLSELYTDVIGQLITTRAERH